MFQARVLAGFVLVALAGFVGAVLWQPGPAGPRALWLKQKGKVEEDDDVEAKTPKRKVTPNDDEKPAAPTSVVETPSLPRALRAAKHERVKQLYSDLLVPHDRIHLRGSAKVTVNGNPPRAGILHVEPIAEFVKSPKELKAALEVEVIDETGKKLKEQKEKIPPGWISEIRYYEQRAMAAVAAFLAAQLEKGDKQNARYLSKYDQYATAEVALSAVLRFHQSALETKVRQGEGWAGVEDDLRQQLLGVLLARLDLLIEAKSWDQAFELVRHVIDTFRKPKEHGALAKRVGELLTKAMADGNYTQDRFQEARRRLRQFEKEFPDSELIKPLSKNLQEQAAALYERAKEEANRNKKAEALALLRQAEEIWPELPGLEGLRDKLETEFQQLRIGMRGAPKYVSPARAVTEPERRGVDLLFESLVVLAPDDKGLLYYHPGLAEGRIQVVPLGREFRLPRRAVWSDGAALHSGDVSFSIAEMKKGRSTGRTRDWGNLLKTVRVEGDAFKVKVLMHQGFIDPLALASFKIVPDRATPHPDSEQFAEAPVGSGPFVLAGGSLDRARGTEKNREYVAFKASPSYGARGERMSLPRIREVRFFRSEDPAKDLQNGTVDLAMDLTAQQAADLRKAGGYEVPLPDEKTMNRRIYFLAINHRHSALKNADLRLALALAIDREGLLDKHFRVGLGREVHWALNGPYPVKSWARNPKLVSRGDSKSLDPYDPDLAKTKAKQALKTDQVRLTLKYPAGDNAVAEAMQDLCQRVNAVLPGVTLTAEERDPHKLREDVEMTQSYDLAYWWYDYPDETFWLMPLLGPGGKNGENFLRYHGPLVRQVQGMTGLRHFADVRKQAHAIHLQHLEGEMPFVPLWQLAPLYAHKKGKIKSVPFEVNHPFARIERWEVTSRKAE
jgi:ABC-type transport system substrate-binding protein